MSEHLVIVVHGGAWRIPDKLVAPSVAGVERAARAGMKQLLAQLANSMQQEAQRSRAVSNSSSESSDRFPSTAAVVAAVSILEDDEVFDAGRGSTLTAEGKVEMDAIVCAASASTVRSGAVAAINNVRHPVQVAQHVMENTQHCLLVGQGATAYAKKTGAELATDEQLVTAEMREELAAMQKYETAVDTLFNNNSAAAAKKLEQQEQHDTVGAVALDHFGTVSGATSTGGITAKLPGRVGDSPLFGCGCFADFSMASLLSHKKPVLAACSTTGHGESLIKCSIAQRVCNSCSEAVTPAAAARASLEYMKRRVGGCGGAICVDSEGRTAAVFTTERMPYCCARIRVDVAEQLLAASNFDVEKVKFDVSVEIEVDMDRPEKEQAAKKSE